MERVFINASESLTTFEDNFHISSQKYFNTSEQNYKKLKNKSYLNAALKPTILRQNSLFICRNIFLAQQTLKNMNTNELAAIYFATGGGCQVDSIIFLQAIEENKITRELIRPTPFINSIQNAPAGKIAIQWQNHCLNLTFCQNFLSFETALFSLFYNIKNKFLANGLLIASDEFEENYYLELQNSGKLKNNIYSTHSFELLKSPGFIMGEGGQGFMLANKPNQNTVFEIIDIEIKYQLIGLNFTDFFKNILNKHQLGFHSGLFVILGLNLDSKNDENYEDLCQLLTKNNISIIVYKNECGEYFTAQSYGLYLAQQLLTNKLETAAYIYNAIPTKLNQVKYIVLGQQFEGKEFSIILLKCLSE